MLSFPAERLCCAAASPAALNEPATGSNVRSPLPATELVPVQKVISFATPVPVMPPPAPAPTFAQVEHAPLVSAVHTRTSEVVVLKYSEPMTAPVTSLSAYARFTDDGLIVTAGGVALSVCVPPVMVVAGVEKLGDVAFGVTCKIH